MTVPAEHTRLSVNIHHEAAAALRRHMAIHDVSATETVRRAIALLHFAENTRLAGGTLAVIEQGRVRELDIEGWMQ